MYRIARIGALALVLCAGGCWTNACIEGNRCSEELDGIDISSSESSCDDGSSCDAGWCADGSSCDDSSSSSSCADLREGTTCKDEGYGYDCGDGYWYSEPCPTSGPDNPPDSCCGRACCPGHVCQTAHDNGLGQTYRDCDARDLYTADQAMAAARAFAPAGAVVDSATCGSCKCTTAGNRSAVWCYAGSAVPGTVGLYDQVTDCNAISRCPVPGSANVFAWH